MDTGLIGLDTNILLRATLDDDPVQSPRAQQFLESLGSQGPGFVNIPVVMEFFWVLRSRYKVPRARLAGIIRNLIEVQNIEFEALETIAKAIISYEDGIADFPDAVIAMRNRDLGADTTVTFDRIAARTLPTMQLLT
jgi:predicted nucleic-acid-binding protein